MILVAVLSAFFRVSIARADVRAVDGPRAVAAAKKRALVSTEGP